MFLASIFLLFWRTFTLKSMGETYFLTTKYIATLRKVYFFMQNLTLHKNILMMRYWVTFWELLKLVLHLSVLPKLISKCYGMFVFLSVNYKKIAWYVNLLNAIKKRERICEKKLNFVHRNALVIYQYLRLNGSIGIEFHIQLS